MISVDTETTGLDFYHGCAPFLVSICDEDLQVTTWQFPVNPRTRIPKVTKRDRDEIESYLDQDKVLQNSKFDVRALQSIGICMDWDWERTEDTLIAGHLVASGESHELGNMALKYLGVDIKPLEENLRQEVIKARALAKKKYPEWRQAKEGDPMMPSMKETAWKGDMWLPQALANMEDLPEDHPWWHVLPEYNNGDSSVTLKLWEVQKEILQERGLWEIYLERKKLLKTTYDMESIGITMNVERLNELNDRYREESTKAEQLCLKLADGHIDKLPKGGTSKALRSVIFDHFKLPVVVKSKKTQEPSVNKVAIEQWIATVPTTEKSFHFIKNLRDKRKRDTASGYMEGYLKVGLPLYGPWYTLFPYLNITGTDTLRFSSSNPNEQNISKQEGFNLRYIFGPRPGREWWSGDYKNIELRLPAFECGETEMVNLFNNPGEPPYYGSYHLLICDVLHPKWFGQHGTDFKNKFASTWYQWTKNGNFAVQYGAVESSGTADLAYHVPGAQRKIQGRFKKIAQLNKDMIAHADAHGYVTTIPSKGFDRGYPLQCTRTEWGRVKPTIPLNYHVQGSAMWAMSLAMNRCDNFLEQWNQSELGIANTSQIIQEQMEDQAYFMIMQIHDELVFDFPAKRSKNWDPKNPKAEHLGNAQLVRELKQLMELSGEDMNTPLPVGFDYHPDTWDVGYGISL